MSQNELIEKCKNHNRKAQLQLYNQYCDAMYYVALKFLKNSHDAEEAMQEAFIKAFEKLHQFQAEVTFGAWLKRIVINKSIDMLKARKLHFIAINEQTMQSVEKEDQWEIEEGITADEVKQEIEELNDNYKYPLLLFLVEGYDHQEIAEILNITPVSSRTLVHRGKKKLQEKLKSRYYGTGS